MPYYCPEMYPHREIEMFTQWCMIGEHSCSIVLRSRITALQQRWRTLAAACVTNNAHSGCKHQQDERSEPMEADFMRIHPPVENKPNIRHLLEITFSWLRKTHFNTKFVQQLFIGVQIFDSSGWRLDGCGEVGRSGSGGGRGRCC